MYVNLAFAFLSFMVLLQPSLAQHMNSPEAPCRNDAATIGMTNCFARAREHADHDLQEFYEQIRTKLPNDFPSLQRAERLWVKYRDATCTAERDFYEGGSAAPVSYEACVEEETRIRLNDLKTIYGWRLEKFAE